MLYYAYCTLLDVGEMHKYCPGAKPTEIASLSGFRVAFSRYGTGDSAGGCNLQEAKKDEVLGLLYSLGPDELRHLDSVAGVDKGSYAKIDIQVTVQDGSTMDAITYVVPKPLGPFRPSATYTQPILTGARALRLSPAYIKKLEAIIEAAQKA